MHFLNSGVLCFLLHLKESNKSNKFTSIMSPLVCENKKKSGTEDEAGENVGNSNPSQQENKTQTVCVELHQITDQLNKHPKLMVFLLRYLATGNLI